MAHGDEDIQCIVCHESEMWPATKLSYGKRGVIMMVSNPVKSIVLSWMGLYSLAKNIILRIVLIPVKSNVLISVGRSSFVTGEKNNLEGCIDIKHVRIKRLSQSSDIIINRVTPRGNNKKVIINMQRLSSCLDQRFRADDHVHIVDVYPKSYHFYHGDLVHFNSRGSFLFAEQLADKLSNFYLLDRKMWI